MIARKISVHMIRTALLVSVVATGARAFTGDVTADFTMAEVVSHADGMDVGLPIQATPGTVSGWEIVNAAFYLDGMNDALQVGLDFYGIAGDADGDGLPSNSTAWLIGNGGVDMPNMAGTESVCVAFDFDQNGSYDYIAGVSAMADASGYKVAQFVNGGLLPFSFGPATPAHQGAHAIGPDFELEIANLSALIAYTTDVCFDYAVFAGSYSDDGVGEDFMAGTVCLRTRTGATEDMVSSFNLGANYPNPFNPTTSISFEMAETANAELAVFNMAGQKVATLVNGLVGAGSHEVTFDASNLSSGVYFYTLNSGNMVETRKMILTK